MKLTLKRQRRVRDHRGAQSRLKQYLQIRYSVVQTTEVPTCTQTDAEHVGLGWPQAKSPGYAAIGVVMPSPLWLLAQTLCSYDVRSSWRARMPSAWQCSSDHHGQILQPLRRPNPQQYSNLVILRSLPPAAAVPILDPRKPKSCKACRLSGIPRRCFVMQHRARCWR